MSEFIPVFLPIYFVCYFALAFVLSSVLVAKCIGKSPVVFPKDDSAYALVGFYFKLVLISIFIYVFTFSFLPAVHIYFLPIEYIQSSTLQLGGIILLILAFIWTLVAQNQMRDSWRIGIDSETKTTLVTQGLFRISRNPIFLGMILSLTGLFLITPNTLTLIFLLLGYVLIQIQIRLEEAHLMHAHGELYHNYKSQVSRLLGRT